MQISVVVKGVEGWYANITSMGLVHRLMKVIEKQNLQTGLGYIPQSQAHPRDFQLSALELPTYLRTRPARIAEREPTFPLVL